VRLKIVNGLLRSARNDRRKKRGIQGDRFTSEKQGGEVEIRLGKNVF
jgi:hypothetical protein